MHARGLYYIFSSGCQGDAMKRQTIEKSVSTLHVLNLSYIHVTVLGTHYPHMKLNFVILVVEFLPKNHNVLNATTNKNDCTLILLK